jgi:hypothetical protein
VPVVSVVQVDAGSDALSVRASDASLEEVLDAIAAEASIDVVMQRGVERPPVNVQIRGASLEEALRRVLRRRNYALLYRRTEEGPEVAQVRVLRPTPDPPVPLTPAERRRQRLEKLRAGRR